METHIHIRIHIHIHIIITRSGRFSKGLHEPVKNFDGRRPIFGGGGVIYLLVWPCGGFAAYVGVSYGLWITSSGLVSF